MGWVALLPAVLAAAAAAAAAAVGDSGLPATYESLGKLPVFTEFGNDLEEPGVLERVAQQISYKREIILVSGDGSAYASPTALNTVLQLYALKLHHVLYLSDSRESCENLRTAVPSLACVWSSRIPTTRPNHTGVCVKVFWDMRFYFYDIRKHYVARLTADMGYNLLQTDTDVAWFANPYPILKTVFANNSLVAQHDGPFVNAGVFYLQNLRPDDGASWVVRETARRVHLFLWHPEAVKEVVPWAEEPYYANADEQTLMNDAIVSSITNNITYGAATAGWEARMGKASEHVKYDETREHDMYHEQLRDAFSAAEHPPLPPEGRKALERTLCKQSYGSYNGNSQFPLHAVGPDAKGSALYGMSPGWLFSHYPAEYGLWRPTDMGNHGEAGRCTLTKSEKAASTLPLLPPSIMLHMAGVRSGAWHRRALLRAHGWWHPAADGVMARKQGWETVGQRRRGLLSIGHLGHLGSTAVGDTLLPVLSPREMDSVVANLFSLATLTGRVALLPDMLCPEGPDLEAWQKPEYYEYLVRVDGFGGRRCSWVPPPGSECLKVQYVTPSELQRSPYAAVEADGFKWLNPRAVLPPDDPVCKGTAPLVHAQAIQAAVAGKAGLSAGEGVRLLGNFTGTALEAIVRDILCGAAGLEGDGDPVVAEEGLRAIPASSAMLSTLANEALVQSADLNSGSDPNPASTIANLAAAIRRSTTRNASSTPWEQDTSEGQCVDTLRKRAPKAEAHATTTRLKRAMSGPRGGSLLPW